MWTEYTWIVVSGAFLSVFVAYGIGKDASSTLVPET